MVLRAPTGAGKTTRVPPALLDAGAQKSPAGGGGDGNDTVIVVEPRRLAARSAAARIAAARGVRLGDEVGYQVRFDRKAGPRTRLLVVTEGVLVRRMRSDPFLERVGAVVFDEFHERNLDGDLALAMVRTVQREVRPELAIVAMSATLDARPLAAWLGDAPVVDSAGRQYPVEIRYCPPDRDEPLETTVAKAVAAAVEDDRGDVLVFLPGMREIRRVGRVLEEPARRAGIDVFELHGDLPPAAQDRAIRAGDRRRIVLATNVAESSVTVAGVTTVIDSGLARVQRFDAAVALNRLERVRIARDSADQRAGRAGRTAPGRCIRLWSEHEQKSLRQTEEPEVRRVDLSPAVLALASWGDGAMASASDLDWFERPETAALERAQELLTMLGAVADAGITELGRAMAALPVGPRIARLLLEGTRLGAARAAASAAAVLSERDPLRAAGKGIGAGAGAGAGGGRGNDRRQAPGGWESDLLDRVELLETGASRAAPSLLRARDQLLRLLRADSDRTGDASAEALLRAVVSAYPDRVARRRGAGDRAVLVGGRGVRVSERSAVVTSELFVCLDLDAGRRGERAEALVRSASAVEREWLSAAEIVTETTLAFDEARECVTAAESTRYRDLVLETGAVAVDDDAAASRLLADAAARDLHRALSLDDADLVSLRARIAFLRAEHERRALPGAEHLPRLDDAALRAMLPELCEGRRSFADLRRVPLAERIASRIDHAARRMLDTCAPERIEVPSGSRIRLVYESGRPPVLAARIQELFGLAETPRVAAGRVPVLVHLLAPNGRPQQVTDDLASFWNTTYCEVRKELRRRYPKHAWPEDPWNAPAERRPQRRRRT